MLPASALPVMVGVLSLVVVAEVVNDDGAAGGVASTVIDLSLIHISEPTRPRESS